MATDSAGSNNRRLLFVDDEEDIRDSVDALLESSIPGLEVVTAASGQAGLDELKNGRFDVIISDYKMPSMDGLEFLKQAKHIAPTVPCAILTAFPKLEMAMQAINEVQIDKFLTKPVAPEDLIRHVQSLLARATEQPKPRMSFG